MLGAIWVLYLAHSERFRNEGTATSLCTKEATALACLSALSFSSRSAAAARLPSSKALACSSTISSAP